MNKYSSADCSRVASSIRRIMEDDPAPKPGDYREAAAVPGGRRHFENSVKREIRPLVRHLRSLRKRVRASEEQNESQKRLLAMVAHDVKNPLTAILGYAGMLANRLKSLPTESRYTANICTAAETLYRLINDLVDLAAMESGKLRINPRPMDLRAVLRDVRALTSLEARRRGIRLGFECPPDLPKATGDPWRLEQVIQNLCVNALQYTPRNGRVGVSAKKTAEGLRITVRDTGIGIPAKELPYIFDRHFQGQAAQARHKTGLGLGLAICREIVRMHGAEISVASRPGRGSAFSFTLPLSAPA
ncbi:MAG TPA: hypothetical protein DEB40_13220 [Elusimicrobia bacterium]|nr:hypothetical protein [Elusimicrobiota bacterium]HBT62695.1 hypothetical protein [Elusimicrobiota bacterium]